MPPRSRATDTLRSCGWRLSAGWVVFSVLGFLQGEALLQLSTPLLSATVRVIAPELTSHVVLVRTQATAELLLDAQVARPLVLDASNAVPTGQPLPARANVVHALVPLVILFSALVAMPLRGRREGALLALLAFPLGILVLLVTTPFQLVGLIEMAVHQHALALGIARPEPWSLRWMLFLEGGGRWVLPIAFALVAFALARRAVGNRTTRSA